MPIVKAALGTNMLLVLALHASGLWAATTGLIRGVITDKATGEPVVGATVHLSGTQLGAFSDPDGRFTVLRVEPGTYGIRASSIGYKPVEVTDVVVMTDSITQLSIRLSRQPSDPNVVIVTTTVDIVDSFRTDSGIGLDKDSISRQPVTTVHDLVTQVAGVVMDQRPERRSVYHRRPIEPPPPPISRQEVQAIMPLYDTYFRIWRELADDDLSGARKEFIHLGRIAKSIELSQYGEHAADRFLPNRQSIIALAEAGSSADSIEDIRKHFRSLSRTIASVHRVFGHLGNNYYYRVSCSVFGSGPCNPRAYWFQESDNVRNPLYGGEFLCDGLVEDSLQPTDAARLPIYIVEEQ